MIIEIRAKNCYGFENQISFSMKADMRYKKLSANVHTENNFNVLKTAGIYGPNNSGKTCLVRCIRALKRILSNAKKPLLTRNIFTNNKISELGVTFLASGRKFSYDFKYDTAEDIFLYEKFAEILKNRYGKEKEDVWLKRDYERGIYKCRDIEVEKIMPMVAKNNLLCYLLDTGNHLEKMRGIFQDFASRIDIINMNKIPIKHTIDILKSNNKLKKKMVDFIKNADIYLENFSYDDSGKVLLKMYKEGERIEKDIPEELLDQIRLVSTYKGLTVSSIFFDSIGTKKFAALASYVIEGLDKGRILVVDELDSSMHFKLTQAIVEMFNNELNTKAQMIFTAHDISLMGCKDLLRKEQIWFIHKDNEGTYVYSLADFTAQKGVRDTTDIIEKYKKGVFGAIPNPDFINSLLSIEGAKR